MQVIEINRRTFGTNVITITAEQDGHRLVGRCRNDPGAEAQLLERLQQTFDNKNKDQKHV